jgi:hypothetical protein
MHVYYRANGHRKPDQHPREQGHDHRPTGVHGVLDVFL